MKDQLSSRGTDEVRIFLRIWRMRYRFQPIVHQPIWEQTTQSCDRHLVDTGQISTLVNPVGRSYGMDRDPFR